MQQHCVKLRDAGGEGGGREGGVEGGGGEGGGEGGGCEPIWLVSISPVTCCSAPQSAQVPGQVIPNIANIGDPENPRYSHMERPPLTPQLTLPPHR